MGQPVQLLTKTAEPDLVAVLGAAGFEVRALTEPTEVHSRGCVLVSTCDFLPEQCAGFDAPFLALLHNDDRSVARRWVEGGARGLFRLPASPRELAVRINAAVRAKTSVVCIGGGTGLFQLLSGLKVFPDLLLTSVVTVSDDGGSSGRLRAELGVLPPGDVRRSLVALSDAPELMNAVIQYRFEAGAGITGHSVGNLVLTALSEITGSMGGAVRALGDIMHIRGIVAGATDDDATLCAELEDGNIIRTETAIDTGAGRAQDLRIKRLFHEPRASCSVDVYAAILAADVVIVGPGDLYTSLIANLIVDGIGEALTQTRARVAYTLNLMTKPAETPGYSTADHVRALNEHVGQDFIDVVIKSQTEPDPAARASYARNGQFPVEGDLNGYSRAQMLLADVSDPLELVRHDPQKLANAVRALIPSGGMEDTVDLRAHR